MASRPSCKNDCLDCENYKRKIKENEQTVSARDILIDMLQTELKKKESQFRTAIDEHEKLRYMHCSMVQDYTNLKEIHKKTIEDNRKLCEEKNVLLAKLKDLDSSQTSSKSSSLDNHSRTSYQKKEMPNMKQVAEGITNIQTIMQCQNKSLRSVLVQLLEELQKARMDKSPERDNQTSTDQKCPCEAENKEEAYQSTIESLKKQIENLNASLDKLKKENKKIKENLYEKQASLANCLTVLENNNSDIDNLSEHVEGLCRERDKYREEVSALENELMTKDSEICKLRVENQQIGDLKTENSKLTCENCCLKSNVEQCMFECGSLKKQVADCMGDKEEAINRANELHSLYVELQVQFEEKVNEFNDYKEDVLQTIDQLKNDLQAVEQEGKGTQCKTDCPEVCNTGTEPCPPNHKNEITQVDDLDIALCPGICNRPPDKEMIDIEDHEEQLSKCKCEMQEQIKSLEEVKAQLEENLSNYESHYSKLEEQYNDCTCRFSEHIQKLEVDNLTLRSSLASESNKNNACICELKNKIGDLEKENKELLERLNNISAQSQGNINKLEENYSVCKCALENKIKQLEEENKHLKEALDIVSKDANKAAEDEFDACKCVLENKIRNLEKENKNLKDTLNCSTLEYDSKLKEMEDEYNKIKVNLEIKIKYLEEEKSSLRRSLTLADEKEVSLRKSEEDFATCKCILEHRIAVLEAENKMLTETLAKDSAQCQATIKKLRDDAIILQNTLNEQIRCLEEQNRCLEKVIQEKNQANSADAACRCTLEQRIAELESENKNLTNRLSKETSQYKEIIKQLKDDAENLDKTLQQQIDSLQQQIENTIKEQSKIPQNVIDIEEHIECKCTLELKITQLQEENNDLQETLAILNSENKSYLNKINELSDTLKNATEELEKKAKITLCDTCCGVDGNLGEESDKLKEEINQLQMKLESLEKDLETANLELTEYEEENRSYAQRMQTLMNEITCLQEEKLRVDEDNSEYNQRMNQMRQDFANLTKEKDQTITELNKKITDLECKLVEFDRNVAQLRKLMEENNTLQQKLCNNESTLANMKSEIRQLQSDNCRLQCAESLQKEQEEQLDQCRDQLKSIQKQLQENKCTCEEYEERIKEFECNKLLLEEKIKLLEASLKETSKEIEHLREVIENLEKRPEGLDLEALEKGNQELINQLNNFQDQLKKKQDMIKCLEECIDKSNMILENCEAEMKMVQENNEQLQSQLQCKIQEFEYYKQQNSCSVLKQKIEQLFKENQELREHCSECNQQRINEQISKLQKEYNKLLKESQAKDNELENIKKQLLECYEGKNGSISKPPPSKPENEDSCVCDGHENEHRPSGTGTIKSFQNEKPPKEPSPPEEPSSPPVPSPVQKPGRPVKPSKKPYEYSECDPFPPPIKRSKPPPKAAKKQRPPTSSQSQRPSSSQSQRSSTSSQSRSGNRTPKGSTSSKNGRRSNTKIMSGVYDSDSKIPAKRPSKVAEKIKYPDKSREYALSPVVAKPCPCRPKRSSVSTERSARNSEPLSPALKKPYPSRTKRASVSEPICTPCSNQPKKETRRDQENICPALGKPCPALSTSDSGSDEKFHEYPICPTLGKPCPFRFKNQVPDEQQFEEYGNVEDESICPVLGKPCPARQQYQGGTRSSFHEEDNSICPVLGKPCPARQQFQGGFDEEDNSICPVLGKPCPARQQFQSGFDEEDNSICPVLGKPCPGRQQFQRSLRPSLVEEEDPVCPALGTPCPARKKPGSFEDSSNAKPDEEPICPVLGKPCPARQQYQGGIRPSFHKEDNSICPVLGKPCPGRQQFQGSLRPSFVEEEDPICPAFGTPCPARKKPGSFEDSSNAKPDEEPICPVLGKPCPARQQYQEGIRPSFHEEDNSICPVLGKPCPARQQFQGGLRSSFVEEEDPICPALGTPCPARKKPGSFEDNSNAKPDEEPICPMLGKPCPARQQFQGGLRPSFVEEEDPICPAFGTPCPARKKPGSFEEDSSNTKPPYEEPICPMLGKPCPARQQFQGGLRPSFVEEEDPICPALGTPCPARKKPGSFEEDSSNAQPDEEPICPALGKPCPARTKFQDKGFSVGELEDTICPALGKPCPGRKTSGSFEENNFNDKQDKEPICPVLGKPCPAREKLQRKSEDSICPALGRPCSAQINAERTNVKLSIEVHEESLCPALGKPCPKRRYSESKPMSSFDATPEDPDSDFDDSEPKYSRHPSFNREFRSSMDSPGNSWNERSRTEPIHRVSGADNSVTRKISNCTCSIKYSPECKCSGSKRCSFMKSTGSDPINEMDQTLSQSSKDSCNCMSVIMRQYQTYGALTSHNKPPEIEIFDITPSHNSTRQQKCNCCCCDTYLSNSDAEEIFKKSFFGTSGTDCSCMNEKVKALFSYDEYPDKGRCASEAELLLCECDDESTYSDSSS